VLAGVLAVIMGLSIATPSASADRAGGPTSADGSKPSLAAATRASLAKLDTDAAVVVTQEGDKSSESRPFFKTPKGVAAVVLFVAGAAYTLYSKDKDRVRSPIR
jgi:hypothetical protein